ncbi:MBL fold metallo-hydrolase [Tepidimicrobium xylanilyticum]|uniref:Phosphoribosyl 1,2-cyclic phosphodiesterase n=1 Tax=Tepidimicrobium xylanilyticum TaxID=1123352 RepID=A0A1H3AKW3_9FIRM|nr:MBL fold metallo-hydrolase [Tepidimicrobium xylanilyticum]GMG98093.1 MBL fold hydrolase [Tepidimicrobium xylanilyticum]SDX30350.1 Phosphoribosyl 1,2-cyclic phosphodiesterase [Tepidimicrobium xylanilyticum]
MGLKFCSLSSGSNGNCLYIETDRMRILIDGGLSGKRIEKLLSHIGICPTSINSILVTHEHIDHVRGVGVLSRKHDIPIYANEKTWISMKNIIGEIKEKNIKLIETNKYFQLGDIDILPFSTFHDAADPLGFCINYKKIKTSITTDTGWVNDNMKEIIKGSSLYFIEANHDVKMLKEGRYPWHLKKRILSTRGHLSNIDSGRVLSEVLTGDGEIVILAHLSEENNKPSIAYETVKESIEEHGIKVNRDLDLNLAHRGRPTKIFTLG